LTVSPPFHLEGPTRYGRAPSIGRRSDEVLLEAGYSAEAIGKLRESLVLA